MVMISSPVQEERATEARGPAKPEGNITGWRIRLYYWTRDPHILFWTAVIIIGVGTLLGSLLQPKDSKDILAGMMERVRKQSHSLHADLVEHADLSAELLKAAPDLSRVLTALSVSDTYSEQAVANVVRGLQLSKISPDGKSLCLAYWQSLCSHLDEPGADLLYFAHRAQPAPHANELVGDFLLESRRKHDRALHYFERELAVSQGSESVRRKIFDYHWEKQDHAALARLRADPAYAGFFDPGAELQVSMKQRDWQGVWKSVIVMQKENFSERIPLILTSVAGLLWLVLAWQMVQATGFFSFRVLIPLIAIPFGAVSTLPVLFLDVYQSEEWGLKQTGLFFQDCLFFVAGVGLREELCKLLFFLPFVPFLLMRKVRLETLVVAGCVGLGFAVEENIGYFRVAEPSQAFGRFLTANFFHFAATGVIGSALCDSLREMKAKWWHFPATFIAVVAAHGFYDAFISVPGYLFNALGLSCFILLSLAFFRKLAAERGPATDQIFPAATLIAGLSILVATIIACASSQLGLKFAMASVAGGGVSLGIFVYMFFVLFRDGLNQEEPVKAPVSDLI